LLPGLAYGRALICRSALLRPCKISYRESTRERDSARKIHAVAAAPAAGPQRGSPDAIRAALGSDGNQRAVDDPRRADLSISMPQDFAQKDGCIGIVVRPPAASASKTFCACDTVS
jgi:hypothetical protein